MPGARSSLSPGRNFSAWLYRRCRRGQHRFPAEDDRLWRAICRRIVAGETLADDPELEAALRWQTCERCRKIVRRRVRC